jgi:glycosyltransferase involved in cell wall biosynthesis
VGGARNRIAPSSISASHSEAATAYRAVKILQMVQTLDPSVGGVAPAVMALSRGLTRRGHKIDIVTLDEPASPWLVDVDLTVHTLGPGQTSYRYSKPLMDWLREHRADYECVIVNGLWQYLSFAAWRQLAGSETPYYVFPHGMLDPWFKQTFPFKHLKKWLYWPWAEYRVLRDAAAVIFTSEQERLEARKSFWLYRCREKVSPLGLETPPPIPPPAREMFVAKFPQIRNTRILLFLGRLHPKKGCDILIEALSRNRDLENVVSVVLAGPDQIGWAQQLRARVARLEIAPRIVFAGMLDGEMKQGALASAEAFILPSHQENFGMAVAEALAAGLPVLISDRVNIWREIDADRAGYVESDDIAGTTRLIQRWIATPAAEREAMGRNARSCFERRFEIERAVDSLLQILSAPRNA